MTWLEQADALLAAARVAQTTGDHVAAIALACKAMECVQIHKRLEEAREYLTEMEARVSTRSEALRNLP